VELEPEGPLRSPRREISKRAKILRRVLISLSAFFFFCLCAVIGMGVAWVRSYLDAMPEIPYLENYRPEIPSRFLDSEGALIHELLGAGGVNRQQVTLEELPPNLINAVVALEDKRFFRHPGIDPIRIPKAFYINYVSGRVRQGASTLTTQLAKDLFVNQVLGDGSPRTRTYDSKIKEARLALQIERHYSKSEILEIYLNQVFLGDRKGNINGVAAAAQYYFGKPVSQLDLKECAMLAGILQTPTNWSPFTNPEGAERRTTIALQAMRSEGYITEEEYRQAVEEPFHLRDRSEVRKPFVNSYPYFNAHVRRQFQRGEILDPDGNPIVLSGTGVDVETTLVSPLQDAAIAALRHGIEEHEKRRRKQHGSRWGEPVDSAPNAQNPKKLVPGHVYDAFVAAPYVPGATQVVVTFPRIEGGELPRAAIFNATESWYDDFGLLEPDMCIAVSVEKVASGLIYRVTRDHYVQGALVALQPSTGKILALVGGYDFDDEQNAGKFIRATQALRQPGSAFKPILYACAITRDLNPASFIEDRPQTFHFGGNSWTPENFDGKYHGIVTMHEALAESMNAGSVWLLQHLRQSQCSAILTLHRFCRQTLDMRLHKTDLTVALGSEEMTPLELARAYGIFATGGILAEPYAVSKVVEQQRSEGQVSRTLYEQRWRGRRTLDPQSARIVTSLLDGVTRYGTGAEVAKQFETPLVGKTGTTDNCTNAWFAGYGRDFVCVVFVGFESNRSLGYRMTGSRVALPIWMEFMKCAIEVRPDLFGEFDMPQGLVEKDICLDSGALSTPYCKRVRKLLFLEKNAPSMLCPLHGRHQTATDILAGESEKTEPEIIPFGDLSKSSTGGQEITPTPVPEPTFKSPFPPRVFPSLSPTPEPTPEAKKRKPWWRF